jgi:hypothetical protein
MARSLKSCIPVLSRLIGVKPDMLYERQRALMRDGVLESIPGRGPGSGVHATPQSIALLLIAFLAGLGLLDVGPRTLALSSAAPTPNKKCPLTGETSFKDALAKVLSDKGLLDRVTAIKVSGSHGHAEIQFRNRRAKESSIFTGQPSANPGMRLDMTLILDQIPDVTDALTGLLQDWERL